MTIEHISSLMKNLTEQYQLQTGLNENRFFKIFYSRLLSSKIMVIGYNPGGDPAAWDGSTQASTPFYENHEHEYVDMNYPIAKAMRHFFLHAFGIEAEQLRRIPKTNLIFRRSRNKSQLTVNESTGVKESQCVLEQIIRYVCPQLVVCEGSDTLRLFEKYYCDNIQTCIDGVEIKTPNGTHAASIYRADSARLIATRTPIHILGLGHPSIYAKRKDWQKVIDASSSFFKVNFGKQ